MQMFLLCLCNEVETESQNDLGPSHSISCRGQGHLPLSWVAPSLVQPGLKYEGLSLSCNEFFPLEFYFTTGSEGVLSFQWHSWFLMDTRGASLGRAGTWRQRCGDALAADQGSCSSWGEANITQYLSQCVFNLSGEGCMFSREGFGGSFGVFLFISHLEKNPLDWI